MHHGRPEWAVSAPPLAMTATLVQERLKAAGVDPGPIDGRIGAQTLRALDRALARIGGTPSADGPLAWGAKVSAEFRAAARQTASRLDVPADDLMGFFRSSPSR